MVYCLHRVHLTAESNAYIERYNRTVRYDWLTQYLFGSIEEVQEYATRWLWAYNHERPNMGSGWNHPDPKTGHGGLISTFESG